LKPAIRLAVEIARETRCDTNDADTPHAFAV
jgi:hypothetical protein